MSQTNPDENLNEKIMAARERLREESMGRYQIRPTIGKSFPITTIREIINEILLQILDGM